MGGGAPLPPALWLLSGFFTLLCEFYLGFFLDRLICALLCCLRSCCFYSGFEFIRGIMNWYVGAVIRLEMLPSSFLYGLRVKKVMILEFGVCAKAQICTLNCWGLMN